jgi:hypothetical protein
MSTPTKEQGRSRKAELALPTIKKVRIEDPDDNTKSTLINEEPTMAGQGFGFPVSNDLQISSILGKPSLRDRFALSTLDDKQILAKCKSAGLIEVLSLLD